MKKNNTDTFEIFKTNDSFNENFFLKDESPKLQNLNQPVSEPVKRLNDYDFNLLREDAYKDVSDDLFKLEYKISRTENDIKNFEAQIQAAEDIRDYNLIEDLSNRKALLEEDYEALVAIYNDKSLSARISDKILNMVEKPAEPESHWCCPPFYYYTKADAKLYDARIFMPLCSK